MNFTIGSLFDGSGGFPLAATMCGGTPKWSSEIEPYPIAVTTSRFPDIKHLGSVTDINGAEVEPVDVITFGSPCQDLSVAGKRAGLKHEANGDNETTRSGLFMEAVRIIKEMREATNGVYPRFALWENVPGAFSSNKGEDFRIVLEELIKIVEPTAVMPEVPKNGWPYADSYCGDGWSIAYRVLDAQFWGVPQRRRRIYLVADFRGECAGKVSFEREGLRGYFETGRTPWQTATGDAECGSGATDCERTGVFPYTLKIRSGCEGGGKGALIQTDKSATLATNNDQYLFQPVGIIDSIGGQAERGWEGEISPCLKASHYKFAPCVAIPQSVYSIENHPADSRVDICESGKVQTLASRMGTGGGNVPMIMESHFDVEMEVATRKYDVGFFNSIENQSPTLLARSYKDPHLVSYPGDGIHYIVRRLTPTECARLQGFPDKWGHPDEKTEFTDDENQFWLNVRNTHAAINDKPIRDYTKEQMLKWYNGLHTDSSEYKMWGNGIALPNALYMMQGIAEVMSEEKTARRKWLNDLLGGCL